MIGGGWVAPQRQLEAVDRVFLGDVGDVRRQTVVAAGAQLGRGVHNQADPPDIEAQLGRYTRGRRHVVDRFADNFDAVEINREDPNGGSIWAAGRTLRALELGLRASRPGGAWIDDHAQGQVHLDVLWIAVRADTRRFFFYHRRHDMVKHDRRSQCVRMRAGLRCRRICRVAHGRACKAFEAEVFGRPHGTRKRERHACRQQRNGKGLHR